MFDAARLRLTGWYALILAIIVAVLSFALYHALLAVQHSEIHSVHGQAGTAIARVFARDEGTLASQIIAIDLAVLLPAMIGAYFLAGRTLRPIKEVMEQQRRFAAAASHELRTPLTALQGTLEVALLNPRSPQEYQEVIAEAVAETERMGHLVKDLTMLAQAERRVSLTMAPLELVTVAREAIEDVRPLAERKGQKVSVRLPHTLPVQGDPMQLRQALTNLLDNAVTYTPEGGEICLVGKRERGQAVLEIRDTGVGIPRQHLTHLFEPFYRVDGARTAAGHVGLGLALTAWIVRAHHGQVDATSRDGAGSVFTLSLPLRG
jgi:signal transduction histidine kinase